MAVTAPVGKPPEAHSEVADLFDYNFYTRYVDDSFRRLGLA